MGGLIETLKRMFGRAREAADERDRGQRLDSEFTGQASGKDVADVPPERAAELAGHPTEHVDT